MTGFRHAGYYFIAGNLHNVQGDDMERVRDRFWIWGHEAGSHTKEEWGIPEISRMTPVEGAFYMGIPNIIQVRYNNKPAPPYNRYAVPFRALKSVVWSIVGAGGLTNEDDRNSVIDLANQLPNMTGVMMDDFFKDPKEDGKVSILSLDEVSDLKQRLLVAGRKLDLWSVVYDWQLGLPLSEYLALCDNVSFWSWRGAELQHLERNFSKFEKIAPYAGKYLGCYMWDYGPHQPMPLDLMKMQCETGLKWLKEGRIDGMIFLATCICDLDLEAVEWTRSWISKVGDTNFPARKGRKPRKNTVPGITGP